ncbi:hypothetical protein DFP72DRAFT_851819 [Ephemerocybe angulata]|uniref:Uncharacterized protein n=1 Tax=Ephemerocybe angulata TaxID=980116 RepID=A0A8H6M2S1_9AGAR|nr:hypothetical protein DFP72DRAFT_851819 [Tulosesus angulatus]
MYCAQCWRSEAELGALVRHGEYGLSMLRPKPWAKPGLLKAGLVNLVSPSPPKPGPSRGFWAGPGPVKIEGKLGYLMKEMEHCCRCTPGFAPDDTLIRNDTLIYPLDVEPVLGDVPEADFEITGFTVPPAVSKHKLSSPMPCPGVELYAVPGNTLYIMSHACNKVALVTGAPCPPCVALLRSPAVRSILDRISNGTHKNTAYAYRSHHDEEQSTALGAKGARTSTVDPHVARVEVHWRGVGVRESELHGGKNPVIPKERRRDTEMSPRRTNAMVT